MALFSELSDDLVSVSLFFDYWFEFFGDVQNVIWTYKCTSIIFALPINTLSSDELFVKHNHNLLFGLANHSSTQTKWNVLPHGWVHVHNSVTYLEVLRSPWAEWRRPEREPFTEELPGLHKFGFLNCELNVVIVFFNVLTVRVQTCDNLWIKWIESHFHVRKRANRQTFKPLKDFSHPVHCFHVLRATKIL